MNATEERDQQVADIRNSGPDPENKTQRLRGIDEEWISLSKEFGQEVEIAPWQCFRAGCFSTISNIQAGRVELLGTRLTESQGFMRWPGGKFRSGPIPGRPGYVQVTWAFFTDDTDAAPNPQAP